MDGILYNYHCDYLIYKNKKENLDYLIKQIIHHRQLKQGKYKKLIH